MPHRIDALAKKRLRRGGPDQADLGSVAYIGDREVLPAFQGPGTGVEVFVGDPGHSHRTVLIARGHLCGGPSLRTHGRHLRDFLADRVKIFDRQVGRHAETTSDATPGHIARHHGDEVLPQSGDALVYLRLGSGTHANTHDDGGDAHDDAEHGEEGPEHVAPDGHQSDAKGCKHGSGVELDGLLLGLQLLDFFEGVEASGHRSIAAHQTIAHDHDAFAIMGNV